jgi:hypothetical protein
VEEAADGWHGCKGSRHLLAWKLGGFRGSSQARGVQYSHIVILLLPFALKAMARPHKQSRILLPSCNVRLIAIAIQHK